MTSWVAAIGWLLVSSGALLLVVLKFVFPFAKKEDGKNTVAFFHPYSNDGGGGERVLWTAIQAVQEKFPQFSIVLFSGDVECSAETMHRRVKTHFNIDINPVRVVYLKKRYWVEASRYPRLTMIGQSIGSVVLVWEALTYVRPQIFLDTMGYGFTLPIAKAAGCRVGCYVHYPTISTDMLQAVSQRRETTTNDSKVAQSSSLSKLKLIYYRIFAYLYGKAGAFAEVVMCNSSWTIDHINQIWAVPERTCIVFPPCNINSLIDIPLNTDKRSPIVLSIGQFRPEKHHMLQIKAFKKYVDRHPNSKTKLVLVGSVRHDEDHFRLETLQSTAEEFDLHDRVSFRVNASHDELKDWLSKSILGIHTMWNEHFGISVVEFQAAGVIPIAHNSGGPKADIVTSPSAGMPPAGFLAATEEEYADKIEGLLHRTDPLHWRTLQEAGKEKAKQFSDAGFKESFVKAIAPLF